MVDRDWFESFYREAAATYRIDADRIYLTIHWQVYPGREIDDWLL